MSSSDEVLTIGQSLMAARQELANITTVINETLKVDRKLREAYKWVDAPENLMPADVYDTLTRSLTGSIHRSGALLLAAYIEEHICKARVADCEKAARDAGIEVTNV